MTRSTLLTPPSGSHLTDDGRSERGHGRDPLRRRSATARRRDVNGPAAYFQGHHDFPHPSTRAGELAESRHTDQVILAYDGSPAAEHALGAAAARLLDERRALVLVVWKAGLGFELLEIPSVVGRPSAPIDIRTALDIHQAMDEQAWRLAENGARIAREGGFDAEPLVVAEDAEVPISEAIVATAKERGITRRGSRPAGARAPPRGVPQRYQP